MNFARARGGSALLIVLGMVSFMVVSAVGFAVFMRHNRVPSSYLRRSTAARQLAKAALACAMNDIDAIVDDHGYPGDGSGGHRNDFNPRSSGYTNEVKNIWTGRVLAPYAESPSETVSTLTLEGLAYLPPPMVNDARFYSRRTPTAKWKRLDYDSGRYAFCAIDVSDYFDITRVAANRPRGSGDANLVSLAYLFEDGTHKGWGEIDPIDDYQQKMNGIASTKTLVSLADYNLALKSAGCKLPSPFVEYIEQGGRNGFYGNLRSTDASNPEYLKYAIQRFVVDGCFDLPREEWFERRTGGSGGDQSNPFNLSDIDISKRENQPFPELLDGDSETENDYSPGRIVDISTPFLSARTKQINPCESIALYDYLDCDDIPASVAVPTVERAPMIVGIELDSESNLKVQLKKDEQVGEPGAPDNAGVRITKKTATFYPLFDDGKIRVNAGFAFPFKYRRDLNSKAGAYSAEAVAYMYALESGQAQGDARTCRTAIGGVMRKWPESSSSGGVAYNNGLVSAASKKETTRLPQSVTSENDAVSGTSGQFSDVQMSFEGFDGTESGFKDDGYIAKYHLRKREKMRDGVCEVVSEGPDGWEIDPDENGGKPEFKLNALDVASGEMRQMEAGKTYVWGLSLAVRLFDKNGKLVDMAPAHPNDDDNQPSGDFADMLAGIGRPILRFDGQGGASYEIKDGLEGYQALEEKAAGQQGGGEAPGFSPQTYLTDDPRYNFAAENWYSVQAPGGSLGEAWLGQVSCGSDDRKDNDIFMSVSNQGYLQDPGELAFLPRVSGFNPGDAELEMKPITAAATGTIPSGRDNAGNRNQMWRTYGCFGDLGDDEVDNLRLVSPVRGFRVNPFTDDEFVKLAPYLNTPYDWWAAGTNATDSVKQSMINSAGTTDSSKKALQNALECSFSEWGTETKVKYEYMKKLADVISAQLRGGGADWYETWKDLGWMEGGETSICGVDLGLPLHDVDRKFLCSYWRKCYANAQQLFIVFFRAEPVVIGGGMGDGKTPPQLGARGVAVVWRDPRDRERAPSDAPHAMRVLFYHQFD